MIKPLKGLRYLNSLLFILYTMISSIWDCVLYFYCRQHGAMTSVQFLGLITTVDNHLSEGVDDEFSLGVDLSS